MAIDPVRRMTNPSMPTPVAAPPTLRLNSHGADVAELQRLLLSKGAVLNADGAFGPRTKAAVVAFQRANGLTADGIVGARTWAALRGNSRPTSDFDAGTGTTTRPQTQTPQTPATTTPATTAPAADSRTEIARGLVRVEGTGTSADEQAIEREVARLPADVLAAAQRNGVRVVACRDSVTDYMTDLKGVRPRGWPPGSTWDQVPGLFSPNTDEVVLATKSRGGGRAISNNHGSYNMAFHEMGHGFDHRGGLGGNSRDDAFRAAYTADVPRLEVQGQTYLLQPGDAGPSEAYAETFARYFGGDRTLQRDLPGMYAYWQNVEASLAAR